MKRIFVMMAAVLLWSNISAMDRFYQSLRTNISNLGRKIEEVDVPVIGKLTRLLPFAVLATSLKECPIQTVAVLTAILFYVLSQNESVRSKLREHGDKFTWIKRCQSDTISNDESLFVFDGEDEDDGTQDDGEESLLFDEEFEDSDDLKHKERCHI